MISIQSPGHKWISSPLLCQNSSAGSRTTSSTCYPGIVEPFWLERFAGEGARSVWFVISRVWPYPSLLWHVEHGMTRKENPQSKGHAEETICPESRSQCQQHPPTGPQRVTLEISDRLPSRLLYKFSMCSKDNLACAASRENEGCQAQEEVAIVVVVVVVRTPASGNLPG